MIEFGRFPLTGADFSQYRDALLKFMNGPHAAACLDKLLEVRARIIGVSYQHGKEFGKGEAIYFVMPADEGRVLVMNTDEPTLTGSDRGSLRGGGENKLMEYIIEDNLDSLALAAR